MVVIYEATQDGFICLCSTAHRGLVVQWGSPGSAGGTKTIILAITTAVRLLAARM